jgi:hypothetical protein
LNSTSEVFEGEEPEGELNKKDSDADAMVDGRSVRFQSHESPGFYQSISIFLTWAMGDFNAGGWIGYTVIVDKAYFSKNPLNATGDQWLNRINEAWFCQPEFALQTW